MYELRVEKMSCRGCATRVTKAVLALDSAARVEVDLASKTVRVDTEAGTDAIASAITSAGYPAQVVGPAA